MATLGRSASATELSIYNQLLLANNGNVWKAGLVTYVSGLGDMGTDVPSAADAGTMVTDMYERMTGTTSTTLDIDTYNYYVSGLISGSIKAKGLANAMLNDLHLMPKNDGTYGAPPTWGVDLSAEVTATESTAFQNKVSAASSYTAALDTAAENNDFIANPANAIAWLDGVTTDASLTSALLTIDDTISGTTTTTTGQTYTLTTATDSFTGTAGDDTFIGDQGASTINASDQLNGGAGTDTVTLYGTVTAAILPAMTSIETLQIAAAADAALDVSAASGGFTQFNILNAAAISGKTITTGSGVKLGLATTNGAQMAGALTWAASATDTSATLNMNGFAYVAGATLQNISVTGAALTAMNLVSQGGHANKIATFDAPNTVLTHTITGDQALTYAVSAGDAAILTSINGSGNTGGSLVDASAAANIAAFTFTGGTGNDSIKIANNQLGTLTAGTQLAGGAGSLDKIGTLDTALSVAETAILNATTGFEIFGINAAITLDASTLTSIKHFAVDTTGLTDVINNLATGSTTDINIATTSLTLAPAVGVTDTTVNVGAATTSGFTVGTLVTTGVTTVTMTSNGTSGSTNTITTLTNSDNSVFNISGSANLTITNAIAGTVTGTKIDATSLTGVLTVTGSGLADVLIGGSGADSIIGGAGADTMTGNAGIDNFTTATADIDTTAGVVTDTITDFVTATDKITETNLAAGSATNYTEAGAAAADLATLLAAANTALDATVLYYVGQVGSDSYLVIDTDGTGYTDVIKLTGVALTQIAMTDIY
ncbi:MAG: hypothetical protein KKC76_03275 [Proteobacteria bacterium]|nr:hypothetical protein [Pseudomonadota bacterium]MBU4295729.1 hypothetical protein [Pseudomonadota bacterium]MCG2747148.1 hypothetical protein [Desulfobulbaceae bacterium]